MKKMIILMYLVNGMFNGFSMELKHCSTFMMKTNNNLFIGHNLDESPELHVSGVVCINRQGVKRKNISWKEFAMSPDKLQKYASVKMEWVALYTSVTFNSEGLDFPDGGFNENGLAIFEMSLRNSIYPKDEEKPTLFMCLWMQYVLDTCSTVDEVIDTMKKVNLDGWHWHFFVADRKGDFAIIESPEGKQVITKGDEDLYPVLCNAQYSKEMTRLMKYRGGAGFFESLLYYIKKTPRFVRTANCLDAMEKKAAPSGRDAAMKLLDDIAIKGWNKWQILIDLNSLTVYFHTDKNRKLRSFSLKEFDFESIVTAKMLDIHGEGDGDVSGRFQDYSKELNTSVVNERSENIFEKRLYPLKDNGVTKFIYSSRFIDYSEEIRK